MQRLHAPFLTPLGARPGRVRFLQGVPDSEALATAETAVGRLRGLTFVHHGSRIERLVVGLEFPAQRGQAERELRDAGGDPGGWGINVYRAPDAPRSFFEALLASGAPAV